MRNIKYIFIGAGIIVIWQILGSSNVDIRLYISSPLFILKYFREEYMALFKALLFTSIEAVAGLMLAFIVSCALMIVGFWKPKFLEFITPLMIVSQVVPIIVLAPFFIMLLGIGLTSKIIMAATISFFPIFVSFTQGYNSISKSINELMIVYNAPLKFRITNIYFPLAMPSIMAGLKVSASLAVIGAIVAEFTGAKSGIGKNLFVSAIRLEPDMMMASLLLATILGLSMYSVIRYGEKKLGYWYIINN